MQLTIYPDIRIAVEQWEEHFADDRKDHPAIRVVIMRSVIQLGPSNPDGIKRVLDLIKGSNGENNFSYKFIKGDIRDSIEKMLGRITVDPVPIETLSKGDRYKMALNAAMELTYDDYEPLFQKYGGFLIAGDINHYFFKAQGTMVFPIIDIR